MLIFSIIWEYNTGNAYGRGRWASGQDHGMEGGAWDDRDLLGRTSSPDSTQIVLARYPVCVSCGNPSEVADHELSLQQRWLTGEYDGVTQAQARADADNPARMVGACVSCNSSKGGRVLEGGNDGWNWESSPANMRRMEGL